MPRPDRTAGRTRLPVARPARRAAEGGADFDTLPGDPDGDTGGTHAAPRDGRGSAALWAGAGMLAAAVLAVGGGLAWKLTRPRQTPSGPVAAPPAAPAALGDGPAGATPAVAPSPPGTVRVKSFAAVWHTYHDNPAAGVVQFGGAELVGPVTADTLEVFEGQYVIVQPMWPRGDDRRSPLDRSRAVAIVFTDPRAVASVRRGGTVTVRAVVSGYDRGLLTLRGLRVER